MTIHLEIPDSISQAIRLPSGERTKRLLIELAVSLYAQGILSFGKARELAEMGKYEFGRLLGERQIARHYGEGDLEEDLDYAGRQ
jgi:predicted HTH domain antitoxin